MKLHLRTKVLVPSKLLDTIYHFKGRGDIHGQSNQYTAKKNHLFPHMQSNFFFFLSLRLARLSCG